MRRPDPASSAGPAGRGATRLPVLAVLLLVASAAAAAQAPDAHPAPDPGAVAESGAALKVTSRVLCMCGTCVNQTLHECTCGTAAAERDKVAAAIAAGKTPDEIIQDYVDGYGLQVLSSPDRQGFNLFGWLVPFIATFAGLAALTIVLRGWIRRTAESPAGPAQPSADDPAEAEYRKRLERELGEYEA